MKQNLKPKNKQALTLALRALHQVASGSSSGDSGDDESGKGKYRPVGLWKTLTLDLLKALSLLDHTSRAAELAGGCEEKAGDGGAS